MDNHDVCDSCGSTSSKCKPGCNEEPRDQNGQTAEEWAREHFEFETCEECEGSEGDHDYVLLMGNWFGRCKKKEPSLLDQFIVQCARDCVEGK